MSKTINVVYCMKDYKENRNKIVRAAATVRDDGAAEIHVDGDPFNRLEREQGNWLAADVFESEWHAAFEQYIAGKVEKRLRELKGGE